MKKGGKAPRRSGHSEERRVAKLYQFATDRDVKRELEYQGGKGRDLQGTQPLSIQCKFGVKIGILEAFRQAKLGVYKDYKYPVVHAHYKRGERLVILDEDFWLMCWELLQESGDRLI